MFGVNGLKIVEITNAKLGDRIELIGLASSKKVGEKKDGSPYLILTIQDVSGNLAFPIWDDFEKYNKLIQEGNIIKVCGIKREYRGSAQIGSPEISVLKEDEVDYGNLVPTYEIPEELMEYFLDRVNSLKEEYKKIVVAATGAFGYNEERWNDFITCAAAEKHHGNKRGGLFLHTIGVMKSMESIINNYIENPFFLDASKVLNKDRLMLLAILHDIMKTKEYEYQTIIKRKNTFLDHLFMGAMYIEEINKECGYVLSNDEVEKIQYSILAHHGQYGKYEPKTIEDILIHTADMIDSQIVGSVEGSL